MREITRRRAILGATGVGAVLFAGCLTENNSDDNDDTGSDDNDGDNDGIADLSLATVGSDCSGPDPGEVDINSFEVGVTVEGILPAPNPCHEAVLADARVSDGDLFFEIDVSATDDDTECVQCAGEVAYELTVELEDVDAIETVTVTHATGRSYALSWEEISAPNRNAVRSVSSGRV